MSTKTELIHVIQLLDNDQIDQVDMACTYSLADIFEVNSVDVMTGNRRT